MSLLIDVCLAVVALRFAVHAALELRSSRTQGHVHLVRGIACVVVVGSLGLLRWAPSRVAFDCAIILLIVAILVYVGSGWLSGRKEEKQSQS